MKRRWEMLVVGIVIGLIAGKTYEAVAEVVYLSYAQYTQDDVVLKSKYTKWDSLITDPGVTQIPSLSTNYLISLMGVHTNQVVVRGIDLRLLNENLLGLLVQKSILTSKDAADIIGKSTADAAQFHVVGKK